MYCVHFSGILVIPKDFFLGQTTFLVFWRPSGYFQTSFTHFHIFKSIWSCDIRYDNNECSVEVITFCGFCEF